MSTQPGQWRLLDEAEAAALSLADESMPVTPTVDKPDTDSPAYTATASEHFPGSNDATDDDGDADLPADPPLTTQE